MTNFANRTIWTGDNLDILRGMNSECVDLIYLDPPFNSNRNYAAPVGSQAAGAAFKDTWTLSDLDVAWMGLIADQHPALYQVLQAAGLTHGKGMQSYLCMMGVRLLEMRRVMKDTGSIYLHCDPTASHYLKLLMDAVFGAGNFRSEVIWRRSNAHNKLNRQFGPIHDTLLFFSKAQKFTFHPGRRPYTNSYVEKSFPYSDQRGIYQSNVLSGSGTRDGKSGEPWQGYNPTLHGRHWAIPTKIRAEIDPEGKLTLVLDVLDAMDLAGLILHPKSSNGMPRYKQYLDSSEGVLHQDIWAFQPGTQGTLWEANEGVDEDVKWLDSEDERVGYPTQKPLGLLDRIIRASSNEGDMVLDPFCGCATACVAAENLGRQWVGIDLSPKAVELVNMRLQQSMGSLFHNRLVTSRTDIPRRTDIEAPIPYRLNAHVLFGQQEGRCAGCKGEFPYRLFEVDHIIPQSRGGTGHPENLQMLCSSCNRIKGNREQAYLMARLKEMAIV